VSHRGIADSARVLASGPAFNPLIGGNPLQAARESQQHALRFSP
jgi:hypothetical protein